MRPSLLIGLLALAPCAAAAQPLPGFYLGAGGGPALTPGTRLDLAEPRPAPTHDAPRAPAIPGDVAGRGVASLGYAFGHLRVELEGTARR